MHFGSRPPFCTLTMEQAHCRSQNALPAVPQQCTMGQLLTPVESFALLVGPVLDTSTPFPPCPFQLFAILLPKPNTKDWISVDFGFFHLISLDILFEAEMVFQPYWSLHKEEDRKLCVICRNQTYSVSISLSLKCDCLELTLKLKLKMLLLY